jgi:cytidylate kinase
MSVVTIRGQFGSGAPEIGRLIAESLHADFIDREIIAKVAERLNYPNQEITAKEMPPSSLMGRIAEALGRNGLALAKGPYLPTWEMQLDDALYLSGLESVITELAANQPVVILGRGSQYILKGYPESFHILTIAPLELRVKRVMETFQLDRECAEAQISRIDDSRNEFIKRYFGANQEDPLDYDLVINTEHFTFEEAVSIVIHAVPFTYLWKG